MKNTSLRKTLLTSVLAIILCLLAIVQIFTIERGVAHGESNTTNLEELCEEYTKDVLLTGESKGGLTMYDYESYVNTQFDITNRNNLNAGITDEWIFRIIPKELAEQKKTQYLYVGEKYGFYFDYNSDSNTFFVYLMLHDSDYSVSGHLGRKITPLYYEKYGYNRENKSAALEYKSYHHINTGLVEHYYQKYSDTKKVYLKNVAFSGTLINSNNYNIYEVGYQSATDNGGYFIGGSYKFKGVSTQAEKTDFTADLFKLAIGKIPLTAGLEVGDILTIADMTNSLIEHVRNDNFDFRKVITNENDYSFDLTEIDRDKQIEKFGTLLKDYIFTLDTPDTKDGVLFGIHGEINYAENTFYFNFADQTNKWNTQFAGRIQMDIVEENGNLIGATVNTIASDVESNAYESNIYEDNRLQLEESSTKTAYVLGGKTQPIRFVAPANGVYTIETFGTVQNAFVDTKGEVPIKTDGINQKLKLRLEKGEIFDFKTENLSSSREVYQIKAELTPTEIAVGEVQSVTVKPGETEYLAYYSDSNSGINYSFNKKDNYFSSVYLNNFNNQINSTSNENKVSNQLLNIYIM